MARTETIKYIHKMYVSIPISIHISRNSLGTVKIW